MLNDHAMKVYGEEKLHALLAPALDGVRDQLHATGHFIADWGAA